MTPLLHLVAKETIGTDFYSLLPPDEREAVRETIANPTSMATAETPVEAAAAAAAAADIDGGVGGPEDVAASKDKKPKLTSQVGYIFI